MDYGEAQDEIVRIMLEDPIKRARRVPPFDADYDYIPGSLMPFPIGLRKSARFSDWSLTRHGEVSFRAFS